MLTPRHVAPPALLSARHTPGRRLGLALVLLTLVAFSAPARAALPMDEAAARQAFSVARNWVQRGSTPELTVPIDVTGLAAVHATIRLDGPTVGQATVQSPEPLGPPIDDPAVEGMDLMTLVRDAVRGALADARATLNEPGAFDAALPRLRLDLQFAGQLQRLAVERLDQLPARIAVGRDGLALRRGDQYAFVFPGTAVATNADLRAQLNRMLGGLDIRLDRLPTVGTPEGPDLFRFDTIHLVELAPPAEGAPDVAPPAGAAPPAIYSLTRGAVPTPTRPLDDAQLEQLAGRITEHLLRRQRADGQFAGTYEPSADRFVPPTARPIDAGLATLALARRAKLPGLSDHERTRVAAAAQKALGALASQVPANIAAAPDSAVANELGPTAAALLAILHAPPGAGDYAVLRQRLGVALRSMQNPDGWFRTDLRASARTAPLPTAALATAALAALYDRTRDDAVLEAAFQALIALHRYIENTEGATLHPALPWLAMAHVDLARVGKPAPNFDAFAAALPAVWESQLTPWARGEPRPEDAIGGIVSALTLTEEPTWTTAHQLAGAAASMRLPELVNAEQRPQWLVRCGLAARFLDRLTIHEPGTYYIRNPRQALGGIRLALWDNRQPLEASAIGLLAVTELQHALAQLAGQFAPPESPDAPEPAEVGTPVESAEPVNAPQVAPSAPADAPIEK